MEKPSFKQYLDSKKQLLEAQHSTLKSRVAYPVTKYATLNLSETVSIQLKPNQTLLVDWQCSTTTLPVPVSVTFGSVSYPITNTTKLKRWISTNCTYGENVNQSIK